MSVLTLRDSFLVSFPPDTDTSLSDPLYSLVSDWGQRQTLTFTLHSNMSVSCPPAWQTLDQSSETELLLVYSSSAHRPRLDISTALVFTSDQ